MIYLLLGEGFEEVEAVATCDVLRRARLPVELVGIEDVFGCSAHSYDEILGHLGLTQEHIQEAARRAAKAAR